MVCPFAKSPGAGIADCPRLRESPLCADVPGAVWERLGRVWTPRQAPAGSVLFEEGAPADAVYFVCSGRVKLVRAEHGRAQLLRIFQSPDIVGARSVLAGTPRLASAVVMEPVRACRLAAADFLRLVREAPRLALALSRRFACTLGTTEVALSDIALCTLRQRAARFLLSRSEANGARDGLFRLPFSRHELAEHLGASPEALSRCLSELHREGVLELEGHFVQLLDEALLRRIAA
ncbi:MAG: Crp/Fnr family transcriptional regulator [Elusimicrobia bacterium]|nr:Crp/Fnr family transcriptional regulator [Elusimicrobiota bacterium]